MTIEEYLRKRIEDTEKNCREKHLDSYDNGYWDGYYDALDELLRKLPEMEHEVTLREAKNFCQKQLDDCEDDEDPCEYCPMAMECSDSDECRWMECGKIADFLPRDWDVNYIQKVIREAKK